MAHHKDRDGYAHVFACDRCGEVAGADNYEPAALEQARNKVKSMGWREFHPGWGLLCPACKG